MYIYPHVVFETATRLQSDLFLSDVFFKMDLSFWAIFENLLDAYPGWDFVQSVPYVMETAGPTSLFLKKDNKSGVSTYSYR